MKLKIFNRVKDTVRKRKRQPTEWQNISTIPILEKGLISKCIKNSRSHTSHNQIIIDKAHDNQVRIHRMKEAKQQGGPKGGCLNLTEWGNKIDIKGGQMEGTELERWQGTIEITCVEDRKREDLEQKLELVGGTCGISGMN